MLNVNYPLGIIGIQFYIQRFEALFGSNIKILDWALHVDESTPHVHERHIFFYKNEYGEVQPVQERALEELGIELPKPDEPARLYHYEAGGKVI